MERKTKLITKTAKNVSPFEECSYEEGSVRNLVDWSRIKPRKCTSKFTKFNSVKLPEH